MKTLVFYENKYILEQLNSSMNEDLQSYKINQIDKVRDVGVDFLILEVNNNNINKTINKLELINDIPYIIVSRDIKTDYHGLHLVDIIEDKNLFTLKDKVNKYLKNNKSDGFSIFELPDVIQMISMERKNIAIRIFSKKKVGIIVFKDGKPIYAKLIIGKKTEFGIDAAFKILSWDNIKFKLIKNINTPPKNLNMDSTNLLIGAMQYKDELDNQGSRTKLKEYDCEHAIKQFHTLKGYIGVVIYRDNQELCSSDLNDSYIENKDLKDNVYKINKLVENMLKNLGIVNFTNMILSSKYSSAIIEHDEENKIDVILFLEKGSNIPLSKVLIRKVITGFLF